MLCLAKRDIAPWGAVICLVTEAFFLQKKFLIFVEAPKRGRFLYSLHKFLGSGEVKLWKASILTNPEG